MAQRQQQSLHELVRGTRIGENIKFRAATSTIDFESRVRVTTIDGRRPWRAASQPSLASPSQHPADGKPSASTPSLGPRTAGCGFGVSPSYRPPVFITVTARAVYRPKEPADDRLLVCRRRRTSYEFVLPVEGEAHRTVARRRIGGAIGTLAVEASTVASGARDIPGTARRWELHLTAQSQGQRAAIGADCRGTSMVARHVRRVKQPRFVRSKLASEAAGRVVRHRLTQALAGEDAVVNGEVAVARRRHRALVVDACSHRSEDRFTRRGRDRQCFSNFEPAGKHGTIRNTRMAAANARRILPLQDIIVTRTRRCAPDNGCNEIDSVDGTSSALTLTVALPFQNRCHDEERRRHERCSLATAVAPLVMHVSFQGRTREEASPYVHPMTPLRASTARPPGGN